MTQSRLGSAARLLLAGFAAIAMAGCGYHFAAAGNGLPSAAKTIYVARFSNHAHLAGFDTSAVNEEFTQDLQREISNHKRLDVVDQEPGADLTLSGDVGMVNTIPTAYNAVSEPTQYAEMIAISAELRDNRSGKIIWRARRFTGYNQFATVSQAVITTSPTFLQGNLRAPNIAQMPDLQVAATQQNLTQTQTLQTLAQQLYVSISEGF
ncbi:MAG: LPS assembly lipoprotein LptE [Candidatus Binataceae bacterium]